jgi:hypothetical protein
VRGEEKSSGHFERLCLEGKNPLILSPFFAFSGKKKASKGCTRLFLFASKIIS